MMVFFDKSFKPQKIRDISNLKNIFINLPSHNESYLGIQDIYDNLLLFTWFSEEKWLVENPTIPDSLHRQRYATQEESLHLIEKVYKGKDVSLFKNFEDVPVGEFTLDEILTFKKEDNYLLNEKEPPEEESTVEAEVTEEPKAKRTRSSLLPKGEEPVVKKTTKTKVEKKVSKEKPTTAFDFDFGTTTNKETKPTSKVRPTKRKRVTAKPTQKKVTPKKRKPKRKTIIELGGASSKTSTKKKKVVSKPTTILDLGEQTKTETKKTAKKKPETSNVIAKKVPKKITKKVTEPKKQQATKTRKGKELFELGSDTKAIASTTSKQDKSKKKPSNNNDSLLQL